MSSLLQDVVISSAKASLGHGEASAGTCGLLKLSLTLEHDYVPSLIHFHVLNKDIQPGTLRLPIVGEEKDFVIGGISSFGVSGTNAAVLAEKVTFSTNYHYGCVSESTSSKSNSPHSLSLPPASVSQDSQLSFSFQRVHDELCFSVSGTIVRHLWISSLSYPVSEAIGYSGYQRKGCVSHREE